MKTGLSSQPLPTDVEVITLPKSKSMLARKLCIDFMAGKHITVSDDCDDIYYLSSALAAMASRASCLIRAGESATALRFLTAIAAARPDTVTVIDGAPQLLKRPVAPLVDALRSLGASITYLGKDGHAPLLIHGRRLTGGTVDFTNSGSSQYASACTLISPLTAGGITVLKRDNASRPYLEMTRRMLLHPNTRIEADWSAASYFYEWAALTGQPLLLRGLRPFGKSLQGDARTMMLFADIFGVQSTPIHGGLLIQASTDGPAPATPVHINMADCPDLVPALAMTMAMKGQRGTLCGLGALRIKESDRLKSISEAIQGLGGKVRIRRKDGDYLLQIYGYPEPLPPGAELSINSHGDHRIAMCALAAAASPTLRRASVCVSEPECISKSFPKFPEYLGRLSAGLRKTPHKP